jgi:hypothetical protein
VTALSLIMLGFDDWPGDPTRQRRRQFLNQNGRTMRARTAMRFISGCCRQQKSLITDVQVLSSRIRPCRRSGGRRPHHGSHDCWEFKRVSMTDGMDGLAIDAPHPAAVLVVMTYVTGQRGFSGILVPHAWRR